MANLFPGPRRKIARARTHIATVEHELAALVAGRERGVEHVIDPKTGDISFKPIVGPDDIDDIATGVGDAVHNLRSSLDLLASRVVQLCRSVPDGVHFPFAKTELGLTAPKGGTIKRHKFHRASPEARAALLALRPHGEPHGNKLLYGLHALDLVDKHQDLITLSQAILMPDVIGGGGHLDIIYHQEGMPEEFREPAVRLLFAGSTSLPGEEVIPTLHQMVNMVEDIVDLFGALFRAGDKAPVHRP